MMLAPVKPDLLRWARERAGLEREALAPRFPKLPEWESGEKQPTLRQVEAFARAVQVPLGHLFLSRPPEESLPIPDFRTLPGRTVTRPSPNLLDTIHACQERQDWYRDFARATGEPELAFVGSASVETPPRDAAAEMRETLGVGLEARRECRSWGDALRMFIRQADEAGVLVMVNGVVNSNTHRPLDPEEFRGFALADPLAPLIFINGADTKAAQIFTLAHELAHIRLGVSALSNLGIAPRPGARQEETWCNAVAAEFLVPLDALSEELRGVELQNDRLLQDTLPRLANTFKVSTLVILRRLLDAERLTRNRFDTAWRRESTRLRDIVQGDKSRGTGGGDFYRTTAARVGKRFAHALVASTLEGQTLYMDALRMLGISNIKTFNNFEQAISFPA